MFRLTTVLGKPLRMIKKITFLYFEKEIPCKELERRKMKVFK